MTVQSLGARSFDRSIEVLVIEDERQFGENIRRYLDRLGFVVNHATSGDAGLAAFRARRPVVTLLDYRLGRINGVDVLREIREADPEAQVVMMTAHGDVGLAVEAMKAGARDFLEKPSTLAKIGDLVAEAATFVRSRQTTPRDQRMRIKGRSVATIELRARVGRVLHAASAEAGEPPSLLITGETGAGKELIARVLHECGPRRDGRFISINCAALPPEAIEGDAPYRDEGGRGEGRANSGIFEAARGGVLFLDEIGEASLAVQAKLLRIIEDRVVRRYPAMTETPVDVWVMAASNRPLEEAVAAGAFRRDLLFRLQVLCIEAPPLRERGDDILYLAEEFLEEEAQRYKREPLRLSDEARDRLRRHTWPGNVRELRNVMRRACVMAAGTHICADDLELAAPASASAGAPPMAERPSTTPLAPAAATPTTPRTLREIEVETLRQALTRAGGNVSRAAMFLGVSRDTLRYRMEKFGLKREI